ncbi:MAG: Kazal-type serine protease inhibitor [Oceanicaulis sp.]
MTRLFALFCALILAACAQAPAASPETPPEPSGPFVASPGALVGVGEACGGMMGLRCAEEPEARQYCHMEPQAMCGAADQMGECRVRPMACPRIYRPVCGCDGETYPNACEANRAGASVASQGACGDRR